MTRTLAAYTLGDGPQRTSHLDWILIIFEDVIVILDILTRYLIVYFPIVIIYPEYGASSIGGCETIPQIQLSWELRHVDISIFIVW